MTETFPCTACGGPNEPLPGATSMPCTFCGANLTIPAGMRRKAMPVVEKVKPPKPAPTINIEKEAPDLLRKAQPFAVRAWNAYAYWTWFRWLFPTCLTLFILGCVALGLIPLIIGVLR